MEQALLHLKILLPYQVFTEKTDVTRLVVDTVAGSYGFLPNRLDCTAGLVPGILQYTSEAEGEVFVAVDEGVLIKTGRSVFVSVRHAYGGSDLGRLHTLVTREFLNWDERERQVRSVLARLESGFVRQFINFQQE